MPRLNPFGKIAANLEVGLPGSPKSWDLVSLLFRCETDVNRSFDAACAGEMPRKFSKKSDTIADHYESNYMISCLKYVDSKVGAQKCPIRTGPRRGSKWDKLHKELACDRRQQRPMRLADIGRQ